MLNGGQIASLLLINLICIGLVVGKLIKAGNSLRQALRIAWNLLVDKGGFPEIGAIPERFAWVVLLKKFWWFSLSVFGVCWVMAPGLANSFALFLLILTHSVWFYFANQSGEKNRDFDRIIDLDRHWGVVIKYIDADLDLSMKSLAELDLRKKNLLVMAVERNGQVIPFPKGLEVIQSGDRLVIFGNLHSYHLLFG